MRTEADLGTVRQIRRLMVKHWIDLGRLSVRCQGGRVVVHGLLQRIPGVREPLIPAIVESIFTEIKRLRGVQSVSTHVENWTNNGGMWRPVEGAEQKKAERMTPLSRDRELEPARTFRVSYKEKHPSP